MEAPGKPIILYFIVEYISICIYFLIEKIMRSLCGIRDSESNGAAGFIHVAQELDAVEQAGGGAYPAQHRLFTPVRRHVFLVCGHGLGPKQLLYRRDEDLHRLHPA